MTRSRKIKRKRIDESQWTENDKVTKWEWSKGFSPKINEQMSLAIMIREQEAPNVNEMIREVKEVQVKVIRITKKLVNNTVFVIFEDESPLYPMYRFINECPNVKLSVMQARMDEPREPEAVELGVPMTFGFYEPENERKVDLRLLINKSGLRTPSATRNGEVFTKDLIYDLAKPRIEGEDSETFTYQDTSGNTNTIVVMMTNDGQTTTVKVVPDRDL